MATRELYRAIGARVRISLERVELSPQSGQAQAAIQESAGAWCDADDSEFDRWLESTCQMRRLSYRDETQGSARQ